MKKIILIIILILSINTKAYLDNAKSGLLLEVSTKNILYEKNIHEKLYTASLTKMMGLCIIFEEIEQGNIKYTDIVTVSKNASDMGGSQMWLSEGEKITVNDLLKGTVVASANDAVVALAEKVAGTEEKFVELMNKKVKELNLKNTNFVNVTGLDEKNNYSSAYDLSIISLELLKHKDIFNYTTIYEDYLRKNTKNEYWLVTTNKLIKTYPGCDGLKTGYTDKAGYNMSITAKKNNMRLLVIALGEPSSKIRNKEIEELLDYGFNNYKIKNIKHSGDKIGEIIYPKSKKEKLEIIINQDINIIEKINNNSDYHCEVKLFDLKLPINKDEIIGKLLVKDNNKTILEVLIKTNYDMIKKTYFEIFLSLLKSLIIGLKI